MGPVHIETLETRMSQGSRGYKSRAERQVPKCPSHGRTWALGYLGRDPGLPAAHDGPATETAGELALPLSAEIQSGPARRARGASRLSIRRSVTRAQTAFARGVLPSKGTLQAIAWIDADNGEVPLHPGDWGWRARTVQKGQSEEQIWDPQGARIGWVRGDNLYLEREAAYAAAQRLARLSSSLGVGSRTLWKRMDERGLLLSREDGRYTCRPTIVGRQQRVLHLASSCLSSRNGLTGLTGLDPAQTEEEAARAEKRPDSQPGPEPNQATDRADSAPQGAGDAARAFDSPASPVSPVGEDKSQRADDELARDIAASRLEDDLL